MLGLRLPLLLLLASYLVSTLGLAQPAPPQPAAGGWAPLEWTTVGHRLYSFCSEQDALPPAAAAALAKTSIMIHGMEVGANIAPVWQNSEMKTGLAAKQLRKINPSQLQLYTVQIDYARSVYASGAWFNNHPECILKDADGQPVLNNASSAATARGHCDHNVTVPGKHYPFGACVVYGFDTECGASQWVKSITDACEQYDLDGVFIDGFQGYSPSGFGRVLGKCSTSTQEAWLAGLNASLWALHANFTTGRNAKRKKKIICNQTGGTFNCDKTTGECYCTASNDERWGGGSDGVLALQTYDAAYPSKGVIVHVPHVMVNNAIYNSSLASFLLGAGSNDAYGIGFGYECASGGWLKAEDDPNLNKPLGRPVGPAINSSNIWRRQFASGVKVFMNATPVISVGARVNTCIVWADGTRTPRNDGCAQMTRFEARAR